VEDVTPENSKEEVKIINGKEDDEDDEDEEDFDGPTAVGLIFND
jgi:hypothetical protein